MNDRIEIYGSVHVVWQCKTCGVIATCPEVVYAQHRAEGGFHHCPNGHQWGWTNETCEREKLRLEANRLRQRLAEKDDEIAERDRRIIASKGQITKLKKRASAGTCPCCKRSFANMARHMKSQHPTFAKPDLKVVSQ